MLELRQLKIVKEADGMAKIPAPLQAFIETTNQGDSEAFVALFTPDGVVNDWGNEYHGTEEIAHWNQTDNIGKQSQFTLQDAQSLAPDQWRLTIKVAGNGFNGVSPFNFTLADDQIKSMVILPN